MNTIKECLCQLYSSHNEPCQLPGTYPRSVDSTSIIGNGSCVKTSESNRVELSLEDEVVDGFEGLNAVDIEVKTTTEWLRTDRTTNP